ncbi:unnamed protein product [Linum trigynum]|uniref:Uncharacterized protein n=1 Tax=Linum trigynum TaxID=586398 RepID=A0AAV2DH54_9ROSI
MLRQEFTATVNHGDAFTASVCRGECIQNRRKMAFRKKRLKITKMPSEKIRPNFRPNRPLLDFIVGGEYPKAESVIRHIQNPRKMDFP